MEVSGVLRSHTAIHGGADAILNVIEGLGGGFELQHQMIGGDLGVIVSCGNPLRAGLQPQKAHADIGDDTTHQQLFKDPEEVKHAIAPEEQAESDQLQNTKKQIGAKHLPD